MVFEHDFNAYPELTNTQLEELRWMSPHPQLEEDFTAEVVKVHDGDTVTLKTSNRDFSFPLRLHDIDAPELNEGGEVARDYLAARIVGRLVTILVDRANRVDKYGRLLGRVVLDGLDMGQEMIHAGLVVPFGRKNEGHVPDQSFFFREGQWFQ